jgi:hypothetical protein
MARVKKRLDFTVAERWTEKLAAQGFTPIVQPFLRFHSKLNPPIASPEAYVIVQLMSWRWDGRHWPYPTLGTLAERMGRTERYVRKLCEKLEGSGYLQRRRIPGRRSHEFDLTGLMVRLEDYLDRVEAAQRKTAH